MEKGNKALGNEYKATFTIKVQYKQNASWQGTLVWVEGKKELCFRSELELISLMSTALQDLDGEEAEVRG